MKFLLIEDNLDLAAAVASRLNIDGHVIDHADKIEDGIAFCDTSDYDLILLDIMLPDGDGRSFLQHHRSRKRDTPVIVLTARSQVSDRISLLDLGADDYMTKPFDHAELEARVRAVLRRKNGSAQAVIAFGEVSFDPVAGQMYVKGAPVKLRNRELRLFELFINAPNQIFSKQKLCDRLFSFDEDVSENAIEVYVGRIRKHLDGCDVTISTHRGLGYRLESA
ncbi:MAG: response regulator transcription factor [Pelagimonas sp.]|jgi:two-component system response regulator TctD|nr:response regulator transcription factor [Pelagimonas sp.]